MKNIILVLFYAILANLLSNCKNDEIKQEPQKPADSVQPVVAEPKTIDYDYSGAYKITDPKQCNLTITITKDKESYKYSITGDKINYSGVVSIINEDGKNFMQFSGKIGNNPDNSLRALFDNGNLTIQNFGNSINEFIYFKNCDAKYLTFTKI
jgi:hypothetical protein